MKSGLRFLKYNAGIVVTAIFMFCMAYREFLHPKYGRENVPKIYLTFAIVLVILLITIYFKYFHGKTIVRGHGGVKGQRKVSTRKR